MRRLLPLLLAPALLAQGSTDSSAKRKDILKLLQVSGNAKLSLQVGDQMLEGVKTQMPKDLPSEVWDIFREEFFKVFTAERIDRMTAEIWDKHFSHEEVKAILAFYETPAGKALNQKLPLVTSEGMTMGQTMGQEAAQNALPKIQAWMKEHGKE